MGAMMALTVSLAYPQRFKGVIAHSGMLPKEDTAQYRWDDLNGISFFIAHGTNDPIVPVELGRQAHRRLLDAGAHVEYHEYPIQHTISEDSLSDAAMWLQRNIEVT
jgi:phospholipase/carboxylesterase